MKKTISFSILAVLCTLNASANNFVWYQYDPTFWYMEGVNLDTANYGDFVASSDVYNTYYFDAKNMVMQQTDWFSDGHGEMYPEQSDELIWHVYLNDSELVQAELLIDSFRQQATEDVNTMANGIINQTKATNVNKYELNRMTENIVNDMFNGADITSTDIYNRLTNNIVTLAVSKVVENSSIAAVNITKGVFSAINNQISNRMLNITGRSGGDEPSNVGIWVQGLANYLKKTGESSFDSYTFGVTTGFDKKFGNDVIFGLGYTYNGTKADVGPSDIDIDGHTLFIYGQYRPINQWHIDTMLSVGMASYKEKLGISHSNYDIYNFGTKLISGYDWNNGFGILGGARFLNITQKDYQNFIGQHTKGDSNSVLTLVGGAKYDTNISSYLVTNLHINTTYDILRPDDSKVIDIDGIIYHINGGNVKPFGIETGIAFNLYDNNWNFDIGYDLEWHSNFISHTGHIRAKYSF